MILERFAHLWGSPDYPPSTVVGEALELAENQLCFRFPDDYRISVLSVGLPRPTIHLLHSVVEQDIDLDVVNDFFEPHEIIEDTLSWRPLGLPNDLVAFANDCSGNRFCFPTINTPRKHGSVWLWNHDDGEVSEVADSFDDWVHAMCEITHLEIDDD